MCKALLRIPANSWGAFGPVVTPVFQFLLILYAPATLPHHDSPSVKTVPVHSLHLCAHTAHNICGCRCTKVLLLGEAGEDVITRGRKVKRNASHPWNTYNREISALCYPIFSSHLIPSDWLFFPSLFWSPPFTSLPEVMGKSQKRRFGSSWESQLLSVIPFPTGLSMSKFWKLLPLLSSSDLGVRKAPSLWTLEYYTVPQGISTLFFNAICFLLEPWCSHMSNTFQFQAFPLAGLSTWISLC